MSVDDLKKADITDMVIGVRVDTISDPYPNEQSIREATRILAAAHAHHFTYLLNGTTALRGCSCGLAFVAHVVGAQPEKLRWYRVNELPDNDKP